MKWHRAPAVVLSERVVTPDGIVPASLHLADGRIARVSDIDDVGAHPFAVLDARDCVVLPGLVDTHVHINEPGRADWEGFASATRAAAAGGVTTVLDMPLNSVPATTTRLALEAKRRSATDLCRVDVGFLGGVVPGNVGDLPGLWDDGVFAFKCFLVPSGVEEFPGVSPDDLRDAMPALSRLGATLMVHAELPGPLDAAFSLVRDADPRVYANYLASRPPVAELEAVELVLELARRYKTSVHIVHVSSRDALPLLSRARLAGMPVTAETCPHYLTIEAGEIADGATEFKCAPPVRSGEHRDALWGALTENVLDQVVSDHSPCPPAMKAKDSGDFFSAWGGIASLELGLSVMWTAMRARSLQLTHLARWMCDAPARIAGLAGVKGRLAAGYRADFVVLDPDAAFVVDAGRLHQRHPITPYANRTLRGAVQATYLGGRLIYADDDAVGVPSGALLRRRAAR